jgi:hypothetical protein
MRHLTIRRWMLVLGAALLGAVAAFAALANL